MQPPFEVVLADHGGVVMRVCRALLGPVDAEDAWSETFLSALEAYPRLRPASDVRGWLVTIAHRKAVDQLRSRSRTAIPIGDAVDGPSPEPGPDGYDPDLWRALRALPFKQRAAVACHHLGGLPYAEVGALIHSTEAAARRAAADGMANLRRTYGADSTSRIGREKSVREEGAREESAREESKG